MFGIRREIICYTSTGMLFGFFAAYMFLSTNYDWEVIKSKKCALLDEDVFNVSQLTDKFHWNYQEHGARKLSKKVRILCFVMVSNLHKAMHVKLTWGKKCTKLVFFGNFTNNELPIIVVSEKTSWEVMEWTYKFLYLNYYHGHDWFLRVDDSTYVIMENLRLLLATYSPSSTVYLGCGFHNNLLHPIDYASESGGIVLSSLALERLVISGLPWVDKILHGVGMTPNHYIEDDIKLAWILEKLGIMLKNSRDIYDKDRFHPMSVLDHILDLKRTDLEVYEKWVYRDPKPIDSGLTTENGEVEDTRCCSDTSISFHYVDTSDYFVYEFFLYHIRPYGILFY